MSELREPRGGESYCESTEHVDVNTARARLPAEQGPWEMKGQGLKGGWFAARGGGGSEGGDGRMRPACWYYVSVARREAISKMGEKKIQPGKKRLYPGRWVMPTRLFN